MTLLNEIEATVNEFNRLLPYPAIDFAVHKIFQIDPGNPQERPSVLSMRMETINSLFQSGLGFLKTPIRNNLARGAFNRSYWELVELRNGDDHYELSDDRKDIIAGDYDKVLSALKSGLEDAGYTKDKHFRAFASKLLHWTFPETFPMQDKNSLKAMRLKPEGRYGSVVDFYLTLGGKLEMQMSDLKKKLEEIDQESLPEGLKASYSWIRVVDKWLWLKGK